MKTVLNQSSEGLKMLKENITKSISNSIVIYCVRDKRVFRNPLQIKIENRFNMDLGLSVLVTSSYEANQYGSAASAEISSHGL